MIRNASCADAPAICAIYNHYIVNTTVTFEEAALSDAQMAERISDVTQTYPWIVYVQGEAVIGYAYAGKWRARSAYNRTAEVSIYLDHKATGRGIGSKLMDELLRRLKAMDIHTAIGGASLPNDPSVALQEKFGFRKAAHFHEVGYKFGKWIDVGYWELAL